jgi:hypothetical protein
MRRAQYAVCRVTRDAWHMSRSRFRERRGPPSASADVAIAGIDDSSERRRSSTILTVVSLALNYAPPHRPRIVDDRRLSLESSMPAIATSALADGGPRLSRNLDRDMCHASRVTRHTAYCARRMAHVTRHVPHNTRHAAQVTHHTSHVRRHTSHVTRHVPDGHTDIRIYGHMEIQTYGHTDRRTDAQTHRRRYGHKDIRTVTRHTF